MAVRHYTERVDADGNLIIRQTGLPAGTEVRVAVETNIADTAAAELLTEEDRAYMDLARTNLDFWDNEVDDASWNS